MRPSQEMNTLDFVHYFRCSGLEGLECMSARWVEHVFAPHMHAFYAVSLNYGGRGAFDCRNELRVAAPGKCSLIAPGELHNGHATCKEGWIYRNLHIEMPLMETLLRSLDWRGQLNIGFKRPLVKDTILAAELGRVFESLTESNSLLQNESLLLSVVSRLVSDHVVRGRAHSETGHEHGSVLRVKNWLDAHSDENVSIHSLAGLARLSPYYLIRVFHRQVGISPHKYQMIVRINRARKLLASGASISDAAYLAGFCDQSHLNRCFRKTLGVTPGRYATFRQS